MNKIVLSGLTICLSLLLFKPVNALDFRVNQLPNGQAFSCATCHVSPQGGGARNAFGWTVESEFLQQGNVVWGPLLASLDSDGDGVPNGVELQDPYGQWMIGQPAPGNSALVTKPGDNANHPLQPLTLHFTGMNPHIGQLLWVRVVDKSSGHEMGRVKSAQVPGADFDLALPALIEGGSYRIDFWADHNGNGTYDSPPTDHAWRLSAENVVGDTEIDFAHNANFTDIGWDYGLTVNFSGMSPVQSAIVTVRLVNWDTAEELSRLTIAPATQSSYKRVLGGLIPGIKTGLEVFADLNHNGRYDAPPTDRSWIRLLPAIAGDATYDFAYDNGFSELEWKALLTLNFHNMETHVGQMFELRVIDSDFAEVVWEYSEEELSLPEFTLTAPVLRDGGNYRVDFYSDANENQTYDSPPDDHAWRIELDNISGSQFVNFNHNINFTDIDFPVSVENGDELKPLGFELGTNFPNPFNPSTVIPYRLEQSGMTDLTVYNLRGEKVANLFNGHQISGAYSIEWNAEGLATGVYIVRLTTDAGSRSLRAVLMK